jgi:hypothetical protein
MLCVPQGGVCVGQAPQSAAETAHMVLASGAAGLGSGGLIPLVTIDRTAADLVPALYLCPRT